MKIVELQADYKVADGDVTLSIIIGDGQIGGSAVLLDGTVLGQDQIKDLKIGNGATIRGKSLLTKTVELDVNSATNKMSITWKFAGGSQPIEFISTGEVSADGDMMGFRGKFRFI